MAFKMASGGNLVATLNFNIPVQGNAKMKRKLNSAHMKTQEKDIVVKYFYDNKHMC